MPLPVSRPLMLVLLMSAAPVMTPSLTLAQDMPPPTVAVLPAKMGEYTLTTRLPGRIKASTVAEVRPQVSGIISERLFEEGSAVTAGQPLYQIEDEIYEAAVAAAKAAVAQAEANHDLAGFAAPPAEGS